MVRGMAKVSTHVMLDPGERERAAAWAAWNRTTVSARIQDRVAEDAAACSPEILAWFRGEAAPAAPVPVVKAPSRSRKPGAVAADADCAHPKARVHKGLCGNCGKFVGE